MENDYFSKRYYLEYLHKTEREPVFDKTRWKYHYASQVDSWSIKDGMVKLVVGTEPKANPLHVEVSFLGEQALMLRAGIGGVPAFEPEPLMVKTVLEPVEASVVESNDGLSFSSGKVSCEIRRRPWCLKLKDETGRVFFEEYLSGILRSWFPVYPLGYKIADGGKCFFESVYLRPNESVYGFGERFGPLDKRGQALLLWNTDTTLTSSDRSYKSIPFYVTSEGYGLFVKTGSKTLFEVGSEYCYNSISFETWDDCLEYIVFYGPDLKRVLKMYTELTGRPSLPPLWSFGLWMSRATYRNRRELEEVAQRLRSQQIPCDVLHIDPSWMKPKHYCDFEWNEDAFPDPDDMFEKLREMGFKICLWEQPYVPNGTAMYKEGLEKGFFLKDRDGRVIHIPDFELCEVAIVDFTNPKAREWYKNKHSSLLRKGVSVFKCDMGEAVPEQAVFHNGKTGVEMHNLYPLYYQGTVFKAVEEVYGRGNGLVWGRSGCAGIQRYPVQWSGDSHATFEDMACVLRGGLSYSLSGVPFWSHDIGGFQGPKPSPTLYVRWAQWGLLSPLSRCHGTTPREPWEYGEEALRIFREFARLRYSLLPYIYSYAYEACETGIPIARPLVLEYQDDPNTRKVDLEYLFGPSLLVIPVLNEEGYVEYYLPKGEWLNWWSRESIKGGYWVKENVPLHVIPLFVRENSVIPRVTPMQHVGEKLEEMILEVFVKDKAFLNYFFDESFPIEASRENNVLRLKIGPSRKTWRIVFYYENKPLRVDCTGGDLASYEYNSGLKAIDLKILLKGEPCLIEVVE
ncbi:MAG: alpha-xylosidase [Thermoproteota archaeon]